MAVLQWFGVRLAVGVGAFATVLALAQATVYLLIAAYSNVAPYAGT